MTFRSQSKSGFTLIEVLIAITLLAIISIAVFNTTTRSFKLREVLARDADFFNAIRLAVGLIEKDLIHIYSPNIMIPPKKAPTTPQEAQNQQQAETADFEQLSNLTRGSSATVTPYWRSMIHKTGIRAARFQADETSMSFVSSANLRVYRNSQESDFIKVKYELRDTESDEAHLNNTKTLFKIETPDAFSLEDSDDDKTARKYPVLQGIKTFKYRFYERKREAWSKSWDNESGDYRDKFPDLIELTVEIVGPKNLRYVGRYKFRPEIPLDGLDPST